MIFVGIWAIPQIFGVWFILYRKTGEKLISPMEIIWNHLKSLEIKWNHQRRTNWFQWISGDFTWFQNHLKSLEIKKSWSHEVSLSPLVEKWRFEELLLWSQSVKPQKQFSRTYSSLKASAIKEKFCKSPFFYRQFLMKTDSSKRKANLPFSSSFGIWGWAPSPINFWLRHYYEHIKNYFPHTRIHRTTDFVLSE